MTAPAAPFTTSAAVAFLVGVTLKGGTDFTAQTTPTSTLVDQAILWISAQIELQFSMAGYVMPLTEISGETWPTAQTRWLQMVSSLGAAAMAVGYAQKPAPALAPGRQSGSGNVLQDLYNTELAKIYDMKLNRTFLRFRADYYASTPAEAALIVPRGPTTDYLEGRYDPMRYLGLFDVADRVLAIQRSMTDSRISWDYLYGLFDFDRPFGTSIYENVYQ